MDDTNHLTRPDEPRGTQATHALHHTHDANPTLIELRRCIDTALTGNPLESILAARRARKLLSWLEAYTVDRARDEGWSWGRIAQYLGIAKQTLHRQHAKRERSTSEPPKREAVTFDERAREHDAEVVRLLAAIADRRREPPDAA